MYEAYDPRRWGGVVPYSADEVHSREACGVIGIGIIAGIILGSAGPHPEDESF